MANTFVCFRKLVRSSRITKLSFGQMKIRLKLLVFFEAQRCNGFFAALTGIDDFLHFQNISLPFFSVLDKSLSSFFVATTAALHWLSNWMMKSVFLATRRSRTKVSEKKSLHSTTVPDFNIHASLISYQ